MKKPKNLQPSRKVIDDYYKSLNKLLSYNEKYTKQKAFRYENGEFIIRNEFFDEFSTLIDSYNTNNLPLIIKSESGTVYRPKIVRFPVNDLDSLTKANDSIYVPLKSSNTRYAGYLIVIPSYLLNEKTKSFKLYCERRYFLEKRNSLTYILNGKQIALLFNK